VVGFSLSSTLLLHWVMRPYVSVVRMLNPPTPLPHTLKQGVTTALPAPTDGDDDHEEAEEEPHVAYDPSKPVLVEIERNNLLGFPVRDKFNLWELTRFNGLRPFQNYQKDRKGYYLQEDLVQDQRFAQILTKLK